MNLKNNVSLFYTQLHCFIVVCLKLYTVSRQRNQEIKVSGHIFLEM